MEVFQICLFSVIWGSMSKPQARDYRILGNFRGKIILLFSQISLQSQKFNCTYIFSDNLTNYNN